MLRALAIVVYGLVQAVVLGALIGGNPRYAWHAWLFICALLLLIVRRPVAWLLRLFLRLPTLVFVAVGILWTSYLAENFAVMMRGDRDPDLWVNSLLWIGPDLLYMAPLWWLAAGHAISPIRIAALAGLPGIVIENDFALHTMLAAGRGGAALVLALNVHAVYAAMFAVPVIVAMAARRDLPPYPAPGWKQLTALAAMPIGLYAGRYWVDFWRETNLADLMLTATPG
ncbi:MAG: hypothetical protein M3N38_12815 [Pseudomonadota bacterium]|nr:hypothetical protein [Pseudomonadota bacterium]